VSKEIEQHYFAPQIRQPKLFAVGCGKDEIWCVFADQRMRFLLSDHNTRKEQKSDKTPNRTSHPLHLLSSLPTNLPAVTDSMDDDQTPFLVNSVDCSPIANSQFEITFPLAVQRFWLNFIKMLCQPIKFQQDSVHHLRGKPF